METIFDSADVPVRDRVDAWAAVTARALMTTTIRLHDPARFTARLEVLPLGVAQLTALSYGPLTSLRTPRLIRQSDPEFYQLALIRTGRQVIEQVRATACLRPGDMVLYDSSLPFDATVPQAAANPSAAVVLQFPKRLMPLPEASLARLLAVPLPTHGTGRLFAQFVTALIDGPAARFRPPDLSRLGNLAVDLATAVLAHCVEGEAPPSARTSHDVLFLRVARFIEERLPAPDLAPAMVARAHQISLRHLYRIFQRRGTTIAAFIRQQRLARCRRDLADPYLSHLTVESIARRWGFPRAADFTRTFRREIGLSPSEYRAMTRMGTPPS